MPIRQRLEPAAGSVDALMLLEPVAIPETGVVTQAVLEGLKNIVERAPTLLVVSDSRRGLRGYPPVTLKMNAAELQALTGTVAPLGLDTIKQTAATLATERDRAVFVTLAER